jgi:threonine aldolase
MAPHVDLRSDTVTRPTKGMRAAMASAEVGDDVFGEDPSVQRLEQDLAERFGHEAGLFCPSGTMANQIALHVHVRPGDEVLCDEGAHVYRYEGGGIMANSGCSVKFIPSHRGRFTAQALHQAVSNAGDPHQARSRVVVVENTSNLGGGALWSMQEVLQIRAVCDTLGLTLHLDGARIFNALVATGESAAQWGSAFHTLSVCLSKGLGAPVGSVLLGSRAVVAEARRVRKRWGGGMRQAGVIAAAGSYALAHHVRRLTEDHARAKTIAALLAQQAFVAEVLPTETNIVLFRTAGALTAAEILDALRPQGILALAMDPHWVRMVTHLDVDDQGVERVARALAHIRL